MASLMRCKSCGFVLAEGKLGDVCPACGVPRKMFEPWNDPVSPKRRMILGLDLHPIVVHFPISFGAAAFVVSVFVLAFPELFADTARIILSTFAGVLPLVAAAAIATGLFDGKVRFRRVTTQLLKRKIALGTVFTVSALAAAIITLVFGTSVLWVRVVDVALLTSCVIASVGLGKIGSSLMSALFPG